MPLGLSTVRTISYLLHPPLLEEAGLVSTVGWYADGFATRSGIVATVEIPETFGRLNKEIELALFRVLQESLTNVHRHSGSKTVSVRIGADSERVWLEVEDQGKGSTNGSVRAGVGITGMRERIKNLAGEPRSGLTRAAHAFVSFSLCRPQPAVPARARNNYSQRVRAGFREYRAFAAGD